MSQENPNLEPHRIAALTISICKDEVESVIGEALSALDDGSAWGRAYMKTCKALRELDPDWTDENTSD